MFTHREIDSMTSKLATIAAVYMDPGNPAPALSSDGQTTPVLFGSRLPLQRKKG